MNKGHRERMRERINKHGIEGLSDHELLEYLLYFVQPRVNTNDTAHALINTFSTINRVFDSDQTELAKVGGIGPQSAQFLALIPEICRRYYVSRHDKRERFISLGRVVEYLDALYLGVMEETAMILLLDAEKTLISSKVIAKGNMEEVSVHNREIVSAVLGHNAVYVVFSHNHPSNDPYPSAEDALLTNHLYVTLKSIGAALMDHVIICPNGNFYSFSKENRL